MAAALSLVIALAFMPALGAGNNAKAASKEPTAISVTHAGSFERPELNYEGYEYDYYYDYDDDSYFQTGDVLTITYNDGSKEAYTYNYDHKKGADFYNADGTKSLEELTGYTYGIEYNKDNPKYIAGNTVYFNYYLRYRVGEYYDEWDDEYYGEYKKVYSGKVPVKLVDPAQQIAINGISYIYDAYKKYAYVSDLDADGDVQGAVAIPDQVTFKNNKTYPVKRISYGALAGATKMTSLTIPEGIEVIGEDAFVNTGLKEITIPKTVISIGEHAIGFNRVYNANTAVLEYTAVPDFVITGEKDTMADGYATANGIKFSDPVAEEAEAAKEAEAAANAQNLIKLKAVNKKMKLKAKAAKKGKAKLSWKANKNIDGYVVLMAEKKTGKFKVLKTIKKNTVKKLTVKKLKKGKKYFFKIRSFVKIDKKTFNSPDSVVKAVKAK